ncbi:MAG: O-antigen ligase family protein [Chloroflexi bacterium]|nr:O-antigen ligase family protein [Chloroflexota bacterium]
MLYALFGRRVWIGQLRYQLFDRHYNLTLRVGMVLLCLGLTLASAFLFRTSRLQGMDVLPGLMPVLIGVGLAGALISYYHLPTIVLLLLPVSTLLADGINTGTGTKISFTFLLLHALVGMWLFKNVVVNRRFDIPRTPVTLPATLFIITIAISFFWGSGYVEADARPFLEEKLFPRLMTTAVLIVSPLTCLLFAAQFQPQRHTRWVIWWFLGVGVVFLVARLALGEVPSPLNAKGQFPAWIGALAAGQLFFNRSLKRLTRLLLVGILLGWLYVTLILGQTWLSGWLPLLVVLVILIALRSRWLLAAVLIIGVIVIAANWDVVEARFSGENQESGTSRTVAWNNTFNVVEGHWLFGTGPAGYAFYFTARLTGFFQFSHNNYIDILAQLGITGLIAFVWIWLAINWFNIRGYRRMPKDGSPQHGLAASIVAINLTTLVVMMLGDWVTPFTYTQGLQGIDYTIWAWLFAGLGLALHGRSQALNTNDESAG